MMNLSDIPTSDLVKELSKRDNVTMFDRPLSEVLDLVMEREAEEVRLKYEAKKSVDIRIVSEEDLKVVREIYEDKGVDPEDYEDFLKPGEVTNCRDCLLQIGGPFEEVSCAKFGYDPDWNEWWFGGSAMGIYPGCRLSKKRG